MSLPRLRLEKCTFLGDGTWHLDPQQVHYLLHVRRCYTGSLVEGLSEGEKLLLRLVCRGENVFAEEVEKRPFDEVPVRVILLVGLLKADQFDLLLRQATEIGVAAIQPLFCRRSVPKLEGKSLEQKLRRWERILEEATLQAGVTHPPTLFPPIDVFSLNESTLPQKRYLALLDPQASPLASLPLALDLSIAIGPEGDWEADEVAFLKERGFLPFMMGTRVLRACTAALVSAAFFIFASWKKEEHS